MHAIDLRSDTITRPTPAMRKAMADAEVGDDVFKEDPTVNRLEEMAAQRMGKSAALLVASGTMGNLVSQLTHCGRGDETILGDQSHVFFYEQGGASALGGIHPRPLANALDGTIAVKAIEAAIRPDDVHFPRSRLVILENTHNRCSGTPLAPAYTSEVGRLTKRNGLKLHIDGARIFNAAAALGVDVAELAAPADSVTFCLSKGLAAPVGSVVCGDADFIARARRMRKSVGGGMRQAGIIAAAGIVALENMVERLAEDHANARSLAEGLVEIKGLMLDPEAIFTNIVYFRVTKPGMDAPTLVARLAEQGIRVLPTAPDQIRAVINYHVTPSDVARAVAIFGRIMKHPS
ncbi:MAG: low-specificity L-threonine aldolase [Desulfosarcina sp.]|jgi:threonine aldolase